MNPLLQAVAWVVANSIAVGLSVALCMIYYLDWQHRSDDDPPSVTRTRTEHLWDQAERIFVRLFMMSLAILAVIGSADNPNPPEYTVLTFSIRLAFTLVCVALIFGDARRLRARAAWEGDVFATRAIVSAHPTEKKSNGEHTVTVAEHTVDIKDKEVA